MPNPNANFAIPKAEPLAANWRPAPTPAQPITKPSSQIGDHISSAQGNTNA